MESWHTSMNPCATGLQQWHHCANPLNKVSGAQQGSVTHEQMQYRHPGIPACPSFKCLHAHSIKWGAPCFHKAFWSLSDGKDHTDVSRWHEYRIPEHGDRTPKVMRLKHNTAQSTCSKGPVYMALTSAKASSSKGTFLSQLCCISNMLIIRAITPTTSDGSILPKSLSQSSPMHH